MRARLRVKPLRTAPLGDPGHSFPHQEGRGRTEVHLLSSIPQANIMGSIRQTLEILAEISAATAAILWFLRAAFD